MAVKNKYRKVNNFFNRVAINFDNFYSWKRRIFFHILFWTFLLSIYTFDMLLVNTGFTINIAFVLSLRQIVQSIFAFYFICYLVIPKLITQGKFVLGIPALFIPFIVAPSINYIVFIATHNALLSDKVSAGLIQRGMFVHDFHSLFDSRSISLSFMPIILRTMPAFLMKLLVSTIRFFSNANKQKIKQHTLEMENLQLEVNFLKSQMNPHYLFNTLNNIYSYVFLKDDRALSMITDLSEVMRYTLYESKEIVVPLERELRFMEYYLDMEKMRNEDNNAQIEFHIDCTLTGEYVIAPLILFPFVENAVKYGINQDKVSGWMRVSIAAAGGELVFSVRNSKAPYKIKVRETNKEHAGGIGIDSTKRRLNLLYPGHKLIIEDTADTYSVLLKIKCLKNEPEIAMHHR